MEAFIFLQIKNVHILDHIILLTVKLRSCAVQGEKAKKFSQLSGVDKTTNQVKPVFFPTFIWEKGTGLKDVSQAVFLDDIRRRDVFLLYTKSLDIDWKKPCSLEKSLDSGSGP